MSAPPDTGELLAVAIDLAVRAGDTARAGRRSATLDPTTKSTATDLVTVFDKAAERTIVDGLVAARPADGIVGEEGTDRTGTSGVDWYVDPIDGTTNFVYDLPHGRRPSPPVTSTACSSVSCTRRSSTSCSPQRGAAAPR